MDLTWSSGSIWAGVVGWWRVREWLGRRAGALGCEPAALATEPFPTCPPGLFTVALCPVGVGLEAGEDDVAEAPLEGAQGLFRCLAFGQFPRVVGAARAVAVADLGDCGHVDGVVEPPVAAPGQPVDLRRPEDTSIGAVPL